MGEIGLHSSNFDPLMSALGQKQTLGKVRLMSALPPIADIRHSNCDVCFGQKRTFGIGLILAEIGWLMAYGGTIVR
jgi:hypothetical protein